MELLAIVTSFTCMRTDFVIIHQYDKNKLIQLTQKSMQHLLLLANLIAIHRKHESLRKSDSRHLKRHTINNSEPFLNQ